MNTRKFKKHLFFGLVPIALVLSKAVLSAEFDVAQSPLAVQDTASPNVMLALSRDHQLYSKAYPDTSDLNNDGFLDITYNNSIDYYGYFDSNRCYTYSSNLFEPAGIATAHQCSSQWSGNFLNWATMTRIDILRKVLYGGYRSTDNGYEVDGATTVLERTMIPYDAHAFVKVYSDADKMLKYTPYSKAVISICNLTEVSIDGKSSYPSRDINTTINPPLIRVASGSDSGSTGWPKWASLSDRECEWDRDNAPRTSDSLAELKVKVKVCVNGKEETNCTSYANSSDSSQITKKPTGLLQKYWEREKPINFGLVTGSWQYNKSGGVLRAIAQSGSNEVSPDDGTFRVLEPASGGIIATLNRFRISDYDFGYKSYSDHSNEYFDWGNPLSEIYLETLRYLAGNNAATASFDANDSSYLPSVIPPLADAYTMGRKTWNTPVTKSNWCAQNSIIAMSAGINSFDTDNLSIDTTSETNAIGTIEGISGKYLIGGNGSTNDGLCTGKSLANLASAEGICPDGASLKGGYDIAGLAYYARTHDFYTTTSVNPSDSDETYYEGEQFINTYGVALSENAPRFEIPIDKGTITILPACQSKISHAWHTWHSCGITDLRVESLTYSGANLISGRLIVTWEDTTAGSDYEMDGIEQLDFCVGAVCTSPISANKVKITTSILDTSSDRDMRFGYTIAGSDSDGPKFPVCHGYDHCSATDDSPPSYTASGNATLLQSPLWYAAKYGGFNTVDKNNLQNPQYQSWDDDENGVPDAFFKATNPILLEGMLDAALNTVAEKLSSSTSVVANSTSTNSTRADASLALFHARFSPAVWTGQLLAYPIDSSDGTIASIESWDAGDMVTSQGTNRSIFSYNGGGVVFNYANLSNDQKALITENQLDYIKGDTSNEKPVGTFRTRMGLLGDIVNSTPKLITSLSQGYDSLPAPAGTDYLKYITSPAFMARAPMLAVGANDGMLHVFNASLGTADSGKEIMAYVPSTVIANLKYLTEPSYISNGHHKYFVDGSPNVGDAYFDTNGAGKWRTALVGTLGAGGKGVFALDLTFLSPSSYQTKENAFMASHVLWEINNKSAPKAQDLTDDGNRYGFANYLGLTVGQASIVRMANGHFAAVFGNGYNSVKQQAVLYIVNIENGHLIRSIATGVGSANSKSTVNGLATPLAVDANGDHIVDAVYAGDHQGNFWKFDVSNSNPNNWGVAFTAGDQPAPLFKAVTTATPAKPQAITAKPEFGKHPNGGVLLYFGTGKYFLNNDNHLDTSTNPIESFYALWDSCLNYAGGGATCSNTPISGKSALVSQSIIYQDAENRVTSDNTLDYSTKKGWYIDLYNGSDVTGERVVNQAILRNRRVIFPTLYPKAGQCVAGGSSWLMMVDALTGKRLDVYGFDLDKNAEFNENDKKSIGGGGSKVSVSGVKSKAILNQPAIIQINNGTEKLYSPDSSGNSFSTGIQKPDIKRQSWTQIR
ncbi:MAG: PilC/PilY family type IV pilus protein [Methylococcales bacterium]|nr:PilC/PilY family type IV pilus protein [Methylococcales bacterium]